MNRTRAESRCAVCKELPKEHQSGRLTCACGRVWRRLIGEEGAGKEKALLELNGFEMTRDCQGDVYYVLPGAGHIIHLYSNGTWDSDKAADDWSLDEYLAWLKRPRVLDQL